MKYSYYFRIKSVIITIIICAFLVNAYTLIKIITFPEGLAPDVSQYDNRFTALRKMLPQHAVVGYISNDLPTDDMTGDNFIKIKFWIARYSLSPVIPVRSLDHKFVVGNFSYPMPDPEIYRKTGLIPIKDFGNVVVLFRREFH